MVHKPDEESSPSPTPESRDPAVGDGESPPSHKADPGSHSKDAHTSTHEDSVPRRDPASMRPQDQDQSREPSGSGESDSDSEVDHPYPSPHDEEPSASSGWATPGSVDEKRLRERKAQESGHADSQLTEGKPEPAPGHPESPEHDPEYDYHRHSHEDPHYDPAHYHYPEHETHQGNNPEYHDPHADEGEYHHAYGHGHGGASPPPPPPPPARVGEDSEEDPWDEEEGGGPVKSFLEHLEDLRWVIIRCAIAIVIAMMVCLVAADKVVELLKEPLTKAQQSAGKTEGYVALMQTGLQSTNLTVIPLETNRWGDLLFPTNVRAMVVKPTPRIDGENFKMEWSARPAREEEIPYQMLVSLKNMGPISPFVVALKIALFGGIGLASPFVFFFIGQFVVPALHRAEKKYLYQALVIGSALFLAGVAFCYYFMLQIALNAAMKFSRWMNFEPDIWRAEEYISFIVKFLLGMGLSFELPVILLTLVRLGLLDYERMKVFRPYWVVVNLALAAVLTPPDVVSQLLMAIPLQVLYEISVLIAWYWHKQEQKREAQEGAED